MKVKILNAITVLFLSIAFTCCNQKKADAVWSDLPKETNLSDLNQTDFAVTLENPVSGKNVIYAPAFLYAWDEIKKELKSGIITDNNNSADFRLINQSLSHLNSLNKDEYSATVEVDNGTITAKASFNKTLPFETKLEALENPIRFNKKDVSAFGMFYYNEDAVKFTKILYYKDDEHFILKLTPKDKQQEIILVKGLRDYRTLKEAITLSEGLISKGKEEAANQEASWKYEIVPEDRFAIPVIKFNISTHYKNIEKQEFLTSDKKKHFVDTAIQRTGFVFNENGAVVESEAVVAADSASIAPVITHPKKMIFDKPFLIIIKRKDKPNPYFVMKVANTELMTVK